METHKYHETTKEQITAYNLVHNCWNGHSYCSPTIWKNSINPKLNVKLVITLARNYIREYERPVILTLYSQINRYFPLPKNN